MGKQVATGSFQLAAATPAGTKLVHLWSCAVLHENVSEPDLSTIMIGLRTYSEIS